MSPPLYPTGQFFMECPGETFRQCGQRYCTQYHLMWLGLLHWKQRIVRVEGDGRAGAWCKLRCRATLRRVSGLGGTLAGLKSFRRSLSLGILGRNLWRSAKCRLWVACVWDASSRSFMACLRIEVMEAVKFRCSL